MAISRFVEGEEGRAVAAELLGEEIPADLFVVSTGVRPEASLADASGLDRGPTGGFATDPHLRVLRDGQPVEGVYAVGDCAEVRHAVMGRRTLSPLASTAVYEARTVSRHLVDPSTEHPPVVAPAVVVLAGLQVGSVGMTANGATHAGLDGWGVDTKGLDRSRYYPGASDIHLRLVGDGDGRIIGAQAVGAQNVAERMNLLALAISEGIPAERLVEVERAYSPPVQLLLDPMMYLLDKFIEVAKDLSG
jgi:NADH oxidase (H2O2-forming)